MYNHNHNATNSFPEAIFNVKPQLTCDMYCLYVLSSKKSHGYAAITDYKTSIMMNTIFRHIKENTNLDFLEESDEESDFENINLDKYVDLNKSEIMRCVYIPRFNKWKPVSICSSHTNLSSYEEVLFIEKKYNTSIYDKSRKFFKSK